MKLRFLAGLSLVVAIGCSQSSAPAPTTASSNATSGVEVSIPDAPSESSGETADVEAAATETLVSLSVPDMH